MKILLDEGLPRRAAALLRDKDSMPFTSLRSPIRQRTIAFPHIF
jgi:hypothetical protein